MFEFVIGFVLGYVVCAAMVKSAIKNAFEEFEKEQNNEVQARSIIPTRLEMVDGQYLLYNNDTNEFLGQGSNYKEMLASIKQRFKEYSFQIVAGDEAIIAELKQQRDESKWKLLYAVTST